MKTLPAAMMAILLLISCDPGLGPGNPKRADLSGPGSVNARYMFTAPSASLYPPGQPGSGTALNLQHLGLLAITGTDTAYLDWRVADAWRGADPTGGRWWQDVSFIDLPYGEFHLATGNFGGGDVPFLAELASGEQFSIASAVPFDAGQLEYDLGREEDGATLRGRLYLNGSTVIKENTALSLWRADQGSSAIGSRIFYGIPASMVADGRADFEIRGLAAGNWQLTNGYSAGDSREMISALTVDLTQTDEIDSMRVPVGVYQGDTRWKEDANAFRMRLRLTGKTEWNGDLALHIRDFQGRSGDIRELRYWLLPEFFDTGVEGDDPLEYYFVSGELEHGFYDFSLELFGNPGESVKVPLDMSRYELPSGWGSGYIPDDRRPLLDLDVDISDELAEMYAP